MRAFLGLCYRHRCYDDAATLDFTLPNYVSKLMKEGPGVENASVVEPSYAKTDAADIDGKVVGPLCTYGRDEKVIRNKLWLMGASSVILYGVGDGMIPYCCIMLRIPCLLIYDTAKTGEEHQKVIEKFLISKVKKFMVEAGPGTPRWYRSNAQLACRPDKDDEEAAKRAAAKKKQAEAEKKKGLAEEEKKKQEADKKRKGEAPGKAESSSSSSSSSSKKKKKS